MPRSRPRRLPCDCLDCTEPQPAVPLPGQVPAWKAAALQDPPPKCLIMFLDAEDAHAPEQLVNALDTVHPVHLHTIAREGSSGFLALRQRTHAAAYCEALAQLLGMHKEYVQPSGARQDAVFAPSFAERYMGMAAGIISMCRGALDLGTRAGLVCCEMTGAEVLGLPTPQAMVADIAARLGISAASQPMLPLDDENDLDMLIVHIGAAQQLLTASGSPAAAAHGAACLADPPNGGNAVLDQHHAAVAWLDAVVRGVNMLPGAKDSLLLVTLLTAGPQFSTSPAEEMCSGLPGYGDVPRPRQSYSFAGTEDVAVDAHASIMFAQRLRGVIRCDDTRELTAEQCKRGAAGRMLLERLLPELAYKMGRTPKYGA